MIAASLCGASSIVKAAQPAGRSGAPYWGWVTRPARRRKRSSHVCSTWPSSSRTMESSPVAAARSWPFRRSSATSTGKMTSSEELWPDGELDSRSRASEKSASSRPPSKGTSPDAELKLTGRELKRKTRPAQVTSRSQRGCRPMRWERVRAKGIRPAPRGTGWQRGRPRPRWRRLLRRGWTRRGPGRSGGPR